jgi:ferric-dicitrate binding protein FerR (iron transport regulator)
VKAEQRLSEALQLLAEQVDASPDAYPRVQTEWRRRERRRRLVAAVLAVTVIAAADGAALWALSSGSPDTHIVDYAPGDEAQLPGQP